MSEKFKVPFAVYIILQKEGKFCLSRRANTKYMDGYLSLIAGHVDGNETAKEAMVREAKEEAGIDVKTEDLHFVGVMHRNSQDSEYIDFFFSCSKWEGEVLNTEPHKCSEIVWLASEELGDDVIPHVKKAINMMSSDEFYAEMGW